MAAEAVLRKLILTMHTVSSISTWGPGIAGVTLVVKHPMQPGIALVIFCSNPGVSVIWELTGTLKNLWCRVHLPASSDILLKNRFLTAVALTDACLFSS